jgi:hypothetical protein
LDSSVNTQKVANSRHRKKKRAPSALSAFVSRIHPDHSLTTNASKGYSIPSSYDKENKLSIGGDQRAEPTECADTRQTNVLLVNVRHNDLPSSSLPQPRREQQEEGEEQEHRKEVVIELERSYRIPPQVNQSLDEVSGQDFVHELSYRSPIYNAVKAAVSSRYAPSVMEVGCAVEEEA